MSLKTRILQTSIVVTRLEAIQRCQIYEILHFLFYEKSRSFYDLGIFVAYVTPILEKFGTEARIVTISDNQGAIESRFLHGPFAQ